MDALLTDNFMSMVLTDIGLCDASIFPNNGIGSWSVLIDSLNGLASPAILMTTGWRIA